MYTVTNVSGLLELMKTRQGDKTQGEFAAEIGITRQHLNAVYQSRSDPGPAICNYLGAEPVFRVDPSTITRSQERFNVQAKEAVKKVGSRKGRKRSD